MTTFSLQWALLPVIWLDRCFVCPRSSLILVVNLFVELKEVVFSLFLIFLIVLSLTVFFISFYSLFLCIWAAQISRQLSSASYCSFARQRGFSPSVVTDPCISHAAAYCSNSPLIYNPVHSLDGFHSCVKLPASLFLATLIAALFLLLCFMYGFHHRDEYSLYWKPPWCSLFGRCLNMGWLCVQGRYAGRTLTRIFMSEPQSSALVRILMPGTSSTRWRATNSAWTGQCPTPDTTSMSL